MVTAILPNWNGERFLDAILPDLAAQTHPPERIIVVDNGSTDGSLACARRHRADIVALAENRGFAHAVNRGIAEASTDLVAIVNTDVRLDPSWLATLVAALAGDPSAAFATGKIYQLRQAELLDGSFDLLSRGGTAWRAGHGRPDGPLWSRPRAIQFPPFTAALFRRKVFLDVGPLDETFESYLEDVDFGLRCSLQGRTGKYVPDAIAKHWGSATLGLWRQATVRLIARNQVFLVAKHFPSGWMRRYGWNVLAAQLLYGLLSVRHGAGWGFILGKYEGIKGYRRQRRIVPRPDPFSGVVEASEQTLFELQQYTGFDRYWKLYFALTRRGS
jgi:GT2 family glycosyltransferase